MTLQNFDALLKALGVPVYHHEAFKAASPYLLWSEYGMNSYYADNRHAPRTWKIQVEYYTKEEYDTLPGGLALLLDGAGVAWEGPVVDYEADVKLIRHIFDCEVWDGAIQQV